MFVYAVPPIDHWPGWIEESAFVVAEAGGLISLEERARALASVKSTSHKAFALAKNLGASSWEGDFKTGPLYSGLPAGDVHGTYLIGWQQSNNGQTFIASPYQLPWLSKFPCVEG